MATVPARDAEAGPVLALAVHGTAGVAGALGAGGAAPAGVAHAGLVLASVKRGILRGEIFHKKVRRTINSKGGRQRKGEKIGKQL